MKGVYFRAEDEHTGKMSGFGFWWISVLEGGYTIYGQIHSTHGVEWTICENVNITIACWSHLILL